MFYFRCIFCTLCTNTRKMNRTDYLELITQTYFNTFDAMFEDVQFLNFSFDYRKNQFVKLIERKQKTLDISLKDFIDEFNFALVFLEDEILMNIHKEIKQKSESELNYTLDNDEVIYVPLQRVNTSLRDYLCVKDIDYIKICFNSFISFTQQTEPRQPEAVKTDEVKNPPQHPQIFKGNNFEIWQKMFDEFNITKSSRTDIDFMFQIMKYDELIYDNIGLTDIKIWINKVYEIAFDKPKYTDPKAKSNEKRMSTYNLINPKKNKGINHT